MDTPYRLVPLLKDIVEVYGDERRVAVAFNLTMQDEKVYRGTALELFRFFEKRGMKGEFVIVVEGAKKK
jgi:16S rRNA (cytidine1402-2'-O)-methyltransferase